MRIDPSEYAQLRSWLGHMVPKVFSSDLLTADTHATSHVTACDQELSQSGLPTLSEMREGSLSWCSE